MEELTEQELDKLWLDMSFTRDYITNKYVYRKLRDNYVYLQQENKQLKLLLNWMVECDFGLDNIFNEDDINMTEEMFIKKTENMDYIESLIYYAKLYLENNKED